MKQLCFLGILLFTGCSGPQHVAEPVCETTSIKGAPSSLTLVNAQSKGIQIGEALSCDGQPDVYIPLQGNGWRQIVMGRGSLDGYAGCSPETALSGPDDGCSTIQFDLFAETLAKRLESRGVRPGGAGLGVCGDINGGYDGWNASLAVLDWAHADIAIEEAAQLMSQLQIGNRFGISVTRPTCARSLEGQVSVTDEPAQERDMVLTGVEWSVMNIAGDDVLAEAQPILLFSEDGQITGNASCNMFFGTYEVADSRLVITTAGTTRMACPSPVMDQETRVMTTLRSVDSYQINADGVLTLMRTDTVVIRAKRAR